MEDFFGELAIGITGEVESRSVDTVIAECMGQGEPLTQQEREVLSAFMQTPNERLVADTTNLSLLTIRRILAKSNVLHELPTDTLAEASRRTLEEKGLIASTNEIMATLTHIMRDPAKSEKDKIKAMSMLLDAHEPKASKAQTVNLTNINVENMISPDVTDRLDQLRARIKSNRMEVIDVAPTN